jgi:hypothetical protein
MRGEHKEEKNLTTEYMEVTEEENKEEPGLSSYFLLHEFSVLRVSFLGLLSCVWWAVLRAPPPFHFGDHDRKGSSWFHLLFPFLFPWISCLPW